MTHPTSRRIAANSWFQRAPLLLIVALAIALVWVAWTDSQRIERASQTMLTGQGATYIEALFALRGSDDELPALFETHATTGLRYVAIVDTEGKLRAEAGHTESRIDVSSLRFDPHERPSPRSLVRVGNRMRMTLVPPPRPRGPPRGPPPPGASLDSLSPPPPPDGAHNPLDGQIGPPPPPDIPRDDGPASFVIEFEPSAANQLKADARRSLVLSALAALSFVVIASLVWRALRQREAEQGRVAREGQLAQLGEMSAVLAHEIRNPLASLKGHAQLLLEQLDADSKSHKKAARIVSEAERIESLSGVLLDFVRSGSVTTAQVSPGELALRCAEKVNSTRIRVDADKAPASWALDALRMEQVLTNLLENAIQSSPDGAEVEVTVATRDQSLEIQVRDHGSGIEKGQKRQIFEPFHTTRVRGAGLGLFVARRIVELHNGSIEASNAADGGAIFCIRIPK